MGFTTSGVEQIAALAPEARVFKAFNQTGFENMADTPALCQPAGHVRRGRGRRRQADRAGVGVRCRLRGGRRGWAACRPSAGAFLAMLWIELARKRGMGSDFAFSLQHKAK